MAYPSSPSRLTRRAAIRLGTMLALAGPSALAAAATAGQSPVALAGHPAVGAWMTDFGDAQPPAYVVFDDNGTGTFFTTGTVYFTLIADPSLPMSGFLVWQPVDGSTADAVIYVAWGDATDDTTMTIRQRWSFDPATDTASVMSTMTHMDADGVVINRAADRFDAIRLAWEPYYPTATPGASPQASPVS